MAIDVGEAPLVHDVDEDLEKRVKLYLSAKHPELGKLLVWVDGGSVRLSGSVSSFHVRQLALSITSHVAGVRHIVDDIAVPVATNELQKRRPR